MNQDETALSHVLERFSRLMRSAEHESGLNPAQWEALRYLDRANRFSNYPAALAKYVGATKGTVSQTLIALERKGLIQKESRPGERSLAVKLTRKGREQLRRDPWLNLARDVGGMEHAAAHDLAGSLAALLQAAVGRSRHLTFGQCRTCRHFRPSQSRGGLAPHRCLLLDLALKKSDSLKICVEHEPGSLRRA